MKRVLGGVALAALAMGTVTSAPVSADPEPQVGDLGTLPGHIFSEAIGISDNGTVFGYSTGEDGHDEAVRWENGQIVQLGWFGRNSKPYDVNAHGVAVGVADRPEEQRYLAVRWNVDGTITELSGDAIGEANGINDGNTVVGSMWAGQASLAVRWDSAGAVTVLPGLPDQRNAVAMGINNVGVIVGYADNPSGRHAVRWDSSGAITEMSFLPGSTECVPHRINDAGVAIGTCYIDRTGRAVRWDATGAVADLGTLPAGRGGNAVDINNAGVIVGTTENSNYRNRAVVWSADGVISELPHLPESDYGIAYAIHDDGTIVGRATLHSGRFHAMRWTPVDTVATILDLPAAHTFGQAAGVSGDGSAFGYATRRDGVLQAVRWASNGKVQKLGTLGRNSEVRDVNDGGIAVGEADRPVEQRSVAVWWNSAGTIQQLADGIDGSAYGINNANTIVGSVFAGHQQAVRWQGGQISRLDNPLGGASGARGINDGGVIVGNASGSDGRTFAVKWSGDTMTTLDTPAGFTDCFASRVNNANLVAGRCQGAGGTHAVRWDSLGVPTDLGTLGGTNSEAVDIDNHGAIVGSAENTNGEPRGVRWETSGRATELPAPPGSRIGVAYAIHDNGTIVGRALASDDRFYAVRWDPAR
jgi:probable HAF family extracellular repeat protein